MGSPPVASRLLLGVRSASFPHRFAAQCWRYTARSDNVLLECYSTQYAPGVSRRPSLRPTLYNQLPQESLEASCEQASGVYRREGGARAAAHTTVYHDL